MDMHLNGSGSNSSTFELPRFKTPIQKPGFSKRGISKWGLQRTLVYDDFDDLKISKNFRPFDFLKLQTGPFETTQCHNSLELQSTVITDHAQLRQSEIVQTLLKQDPISANRGTKAEMMPSANAPQSLISVVMAHYVSQQLLQFFFDIQCGNNMKYEL